MSADASEHCAGSGQSGNKNDVRDMQERPHNINPGVEEINEDAEPDPEGLRSSNGADERRGQGGPSASAEFLSAVEGFLYRLNTGLPGLRDALQHSLPDHGTTLAETAATSANQGAIMSADALRHSSGRNEAGNRNLVQAAPGSMKSREEEFGQDAENGHGDVPPAEVDAGNALAAITAIRSQIGEVLFMMEDIYPELRNSQTRVKSFVDGAGPEQHQVNAIPETSIDSGDLAFRPGTLAVDLIADGMNESRPQASDDSATKRLGRRLARAKEDALFNMQLQRELLKHKWSMYEFGRSTSKLSTPDPANTPSYRYTRLSKGTPDQVSTRVMILYPAAYRDVPLQCHLHEMPLMKIGTRKFFKNTPSPTLYDALSYVWGDQSELSTLFCRVKGQSGYSGLTIGKNLDEALRSLRRTNTAYILWVDAICINQRDIAEKERQIDLMAEIYENADKTIIWLGSQDPKLDLLFKCRRVARLARGKRQDWPGSNAAERAMRMYLEHFCAQQE